MGFQKQRFGRNNSTELMAMCLAEDSFIVFSKKTSFTSFRIIISLYLPTQKNSMCTNGL